MFKRVEAAAPTPAQLEAYVGTYVSEEIPVPYHLTVEDGALVMDRVKSRHEPLEPTEPDAFRGSTGALRFERDAEGLVTGFVLSTGRVRNLRFSRQ